MIRFIDLRGQGTGERFAFWDTVVDNFFSFNGESAWTNWRELQRDAPERLHLRLRNICPAWVDDDGEDDLDGKEL